MRTTLNLDDNLLLIAKEKDLSDGVPLVKIIEDTLKIALTKTRKQKNKINLVTASGYGVKLGIDLGNTRSLLDIMDQT